MKERPRADVLIEGELSPFEHEALYRILRKCCVLEHPSYTELLDEDLATRVNIVFHYPYASSVFGEVLQENWRDLKELFREIAHRRGRAGAAFTVEFAASGTRLIFKSGTVNEREVSSALDQIGHLTAIVGQMMRPETMEKMVERIEADFDKKTDRWHRFRGFTSTAETVVFDDSRFRWVPAVK